MMRLYSFLSTRFSACRWLPCPRSSARHAPQRVALPWLLAARLVSLFASLAAGGVQAGENATLDKLLKPGVQVAADVVVPLPTPTLADGLSAMEQRKAIEAVAGSRHTWEALTRKSVVAPFVVKSTFDDPKLKTGRRVDLWFVAYGDLQRLKADDFLTNQFGSMDAEDHTAVARKWTNEQLAARKLPTFQATGDPEFVYVDVTLLQKVRIQATTSTVVTETGESVLAASTLSSAFARDREAPNQWIPLQRDDAGKLQPGDPQAFDGLGSYIKATQLKEPAGALLIEYHVVFQEPAGWFNGSNLLRSKIPIVAQNIVRQVRRELSQR